MKLYGKKFLRGSIQSGARQRIETRDAILWDIDEGNFRCRVKIQGSNEYIVAHYPRNWKRYPYWLKPGNAVRILHRSGVRGFVEVIGEGRAVPLPVEGPSMPPISDALIDTILTGMDIYATTPETLGLIVTSGTYRINGNSYVFNGTGTSETEVIMDDPPPMTMGSGVVIGLGTVQSELEITDVPAAGYYRYDAFVIGEDGVIHYLQGTEVRQNPSKPTIPADHLLIDRYILVKGDTTEITSYEIGANWTTPTPITLYFEIQYPNGMPYNIYTDTPQMWVKVTVKDQYGQPLSSPSGSWIITLINPTQVGQVYSFSSGYNPYSVEGSAYTYYTFHYQRDQTVDEDFPKMMLLASLQGYSQASGSIIFDLLQA